MTYRRIRFGQLGSSEVVAFAVSELARYLNMMDPQLVVDVLQTEQLTESFKGVIWVGQDEKLKEKLPAVDDPKADDGIAVKVVNGEGFITGTNGISVLIAAYRFLKALGCDWVRPGIEGERIPKKAVENVNVEISEAASYRHRGICIEGADTYQNVLDMIDYVPKVGMNEYFMQFLVPGSFFYRWYWHNSNPYLEKEELCADEVAAMTVSLEKEITRRGIRYHKAGHGWTCAPFGFDATGWNESGEETVIPEGVEQYLALLDGKRKVFRNIPLDTNLCYSNPEVRRIMTDSIAKYCRDNPQIDVLHFWLGDGPNNQCECEKCTVKRPSDWYVMMLNELDAKLTEQGTETKIVFLLYVDLLWEPVEEKLANPSRFIMMFAPITRDYGKNYSDFLEYNGELPPYECNKLRLPKELSQNLEHLRRWQQQFDGDSFDYDYHLMWAHMADPGYERCAKNLFRDMQDLHKIGINGMVSCQIQRCFFPTALPLNMMAAALWNENENYEAKVEAYYNAAFGADGPLVHEYLGTLSDLMTLYVSPAFGYKTESDISFCKDYGAVRKLVDNFIPVIEKNAAVNNACREDWELLKFHAEYVKMFIVCFRALEKGDAEESKRLAKALVDYVNRNEIRLQKVIDGENIQRVMRDRLNLPRNTRLID
ncbi:MAG: DUF4838 domain-containing protein [Oscillospiraceae bacterium]|nr:DUF4838 domain-containing protein [Oscillospiraceae bacterium]MBQ3049241.1 DUF4838 domain-containing protein [Oscillospiraceae bacterium]MBQ9938228.1 DUF4838 domain-containing protein [Oscillospiraceae bacterium]